MGRCWESGQGTGNFGVEWPGVEVKAERPVAESMFIKKHSVFATLQSLLERLEDFVM